MSKFEEECVEVEGEELNMTLPEELVERIVAMVPFPYIFKARTLSKSWLARFSSVSSQDDEEMKRLAVSFQKRVGEYSTKWTTFCPFIFPGEDDLRAFYQESDRWLRLPTLSVPVRLFLGHRPLHIEGALLLVVDELSDLRRPTDLFVANVLTRSWKQLPARPLTDSRSRSRVILVSHKETYKVIEFYENHDGLSFVVIYDSKLGTWSKTRVEVPKDNAYNYRDYVYLNGVLYWSNSLAPVHSHDLEGMCNLLAFHVEEGTFHLLQMSAPPIPVHFCDINLVVCDSSLLMTVGDTENVSVLKIDPMSHRWLKITQGPPAGLNFGKFSFGCTSDGDSIFFLGLTPHAFEFGKKLAYNVKKDEWSSFPIRPTNFPCCFYQVDCFQPGLNPFVAP